METVKTPAGILCFPTFWVPRPPSPNADPRFSCILCFDEAAQATPEWKYLRDLIHRTGKDRFGDKLANLKWPVRNCSEKADLEPFNTLGDKGVFINMWSKNRPGVVDNGRATGAVSEILVVDDVWAGQLARCSVTPFAWDNPSGGRGVSLGLSNVQIVEPDRPRLDGRPPATADFDPVPGSGEPVPAMAEAGDDEIPF